MPIAVTDEQLALAESVGQWARSRAGAIAVVSGLEACGGRRGEHRGTWAGPGARGGRGTAVDNAKDCIQVLGGIGFTWDHDAHLYLCRALALRQLLGGSAAWRARAAQLALAGMRRQLRDGDGPSPFNGSPGDDDVRQAARATAVRILALPPDRQRAALADSGYAAPHLRRRTAGRPLDRSSL